jgi:hypothetical protein
MGISLADTPKLLLTIAVRMMPAERREWGAAMLAEVEQLQNPFTRWRFAMGCARVALCSPLQVLQGGLFQTIMNNTVKSIGASALIGLTLVAPFAFLELRRNIENSRNLVHFPIPLFGLLWLLATVFFIVATSIARSVRAGDRLLAHPVSLLFRLGFLVLVALLWGGFFIDQLPCFLGVPNCD